MKRIGILYQCGQYRVFRKETLYIKELILLMREIFWVLGISSYITLPLFEFALFPPKYNFPPKKSAEATDSACVVNQ